MPVILNNDEIVLSLPIGIAFSLNHACQFMPTNTHVQHLFINIQSQQGPNIVWKYHHLFEYFPIVRN